MRVLRNIVALLLALLVVAGAVLIGMAATATFFILKIVLVGVMVVGFIAYAIKDWFTSTKLDSKK